jgi:hypothetical protein
MFAGSGLRDPQPFAAPRRWWLAAASSDSRLIATSSDSRLIAAAAFDDFRRPAARD